MNTHLPAPRPAVGQRVFAMSSLRYKFQIPDPSRPLPGDLPPWGPHCELIDFEPVPLTPERVVGRTVDEVRTYVGTYGMGGPGFFGLRLGDEWLVVAIWGADSWIEADGRIVADSHWDNQGTPPPLDHPAGRRAHGASGRPARHLAPPREAFARDRCRRGHALDRGVSRGPADLQERQPAAGVRGRRRPAAGGVLVAHSGDLGRRVWRPTGAAQTPNQARHLPGPRSGGRR